MTTADLTDDDIINDPEIRALADELVNTAINDFRAGVVLQRAFALFAYNLALCNEDDPAGTLETILDEMADNARSAMEQHQLIAGNPEPVQHTGGAIQ